MADSTNRNICKVLGQLKILQAVNELTEVLLGLEDELFSVLQSEVQAISLLTITFKLVQLQ